MDEPSQTTVLVGQNYFDPEDRFATVKGQRLEKYIANFEFLNQKVRGLSPRFARWPSLTSFVVCYWTLQVYGCHVVITNISCAMQRLDVLLQVRRRVTSHPLACVLFCFVLLLHSTR